MCRFGHLYFSRLLNSVSVGDVTYRIGFSVGSGVRQEMADGDVTVGLHGRSVHGRVVGLLFRQVRDTTATGVLW